MLAHRLTPILNVSDLAESFRWFEKLGNGGVKMTFGPDGDETADKGVWMSIWVDDVDAIHRHCLEQGLDVAWPPTDMPWGVREGTEEPHEPHRTES